MQLLKRERVFWWVTVPALVGVLATLAVLQYRWSGQISAATRAQMQANLQTSLMGFRQDLARELSAVALELRTAGGDSTSLRPADYARQLRHWQQTAAHPAIVDQVYFWQNSGGPLLRLDTTRDRLEAAEWPAGSDRLREHLRGMSLVVHTVATARRRYHSRPAAQGDHRNFENFVPWMIDPNVPAMVYPLHERGSDDNVALPSNVTWIVVKLNPAVFQKEIFPELTQKYFRGPGGMGYQVAVLAMGSGRLIYSSDPGFRRQGASSVDAVVNLFGPPFRRTEPPPVGIVAFAPPVKSTSSPRTLQQTEDRRGQGAERAVRLEPLPYSVDDGLWQVAARHQRGSLEAAVSGLHRRNLMISFGALVLLALTMALVVIASHRTRRLAALQMNFVAGVSHELRTPLAVISSAAENIAHGVVSDQQQLARYGSSILKQARQLNQLVEQVLVFAATQQKSGNYRLYPVDVAEVIEAALENTAGMAGAAGISVEINVESGLPPVAADFAALVQCLQNLITNAIKYGGDGQWMSVRASGQRINGMIREIEITVEDRGIGISPQEIKQIFEPFYRSAAVAGSNVHGTGLGLPLARTVIEAMRGKLTVTSEPGKGSSFTIHLSAASEALSPEKHSAPESIPGAAAGNYS